MIAGRCRFLAGFLLASLLSAQSPALASDDAPSCQSRLARYARIAALPAVAEPAHCAVTDFVRLEAVTLPDGASAALVPPATLQCGMAEALAQWIRDDVASLARELGAPLASVVTDASYDCRSRNNVAGEKPSEHGRGNAIDIGGVRLGDHRLFRLTDPATPETFRQRMRSLACARFTTVLGPGSDAFHDDHVHLDLAERRGGYRICQWSIAATPAGGGVPLPPRRPQAAGTAGAP